MKLKEQFFSFGEAVPYFFVGHPSLVLELTGPSVSWPLVSGRCSASDAQQDAMAASVVRESIPGEKRQDPGRGHFCNSIRNVLLRWQLFGSYIYVLYIYLYYI
jgi:hypothetical protein